MAWAYVLWATAGGKNFSLSVIWNCGVTLRRTPRGSGCVRSSFSFYSPYTPCTSVVMSNTPSGSLTRRLVPLLMSSYRSFSTKSSV